MKETRHERFKRLAEARTNAVLEKLRLLGNLSNRANYEYTEEEARKIFSVIDKQLRIVQTKFKKPKGKDFKL